MPMLDGDELVALLCELFPGFPAARCRFDEVRDDGVRFRYTAIESELRPGKTVSGPTLMSLSDTGMYFAVLAVIGRVPLAVTTNLNINFLRKPPAGELTIDVRLLKVGKRLAVGEVFVHADGIDGPVSHATVTYSIPERR
jgi:acyl-coenzyme A thioesterase PaaI-like protein